MIPDDGTPDELAFLRREVRRLRESLNRLAPGITELLRRRGFRIYKKEPSDDLLVTGPRRRDAYYRMLQKYSFRLFLRDVIKQQGVFTPERIARYASAEVTAGYCDYLCTAGLAARRGGGYVLRRQVKSFGETLEWYVAEICRREFGAEAVWGVKFKRPKVGGDYDVIARFDGSLWYLEVKSSPPKQIYDREVRAFLDRVDDLVPGTAVFFVDTELRMKDKIVPMFEAELARRTAHPPEVVRMEKELFRIQDRIFIINAKGSIVRNLETVLDRYVRR